MSWTNKEQAKRWYQKYKERERKRLRDTYNSNPNYKKEKVHIVRAKRLGVLGIVTEGIIDILYKKQKGNCAYDIHWCDNTLENYFEVDHILPIALGGLHEDANLQLLCFRCSRAKWKKHPDVFYREVVKRIQDGKSISITG